MVAIGEHELALLKRIRIEMRGRIRPEDPATTGMAVKLMAAGYLEDDPADDEGFRLTAVARQYLEMLDI